MTAKRRVAGWLTIGAFTGLLALLANGCGNVSPTSTCVAGQSIACVGPGGCSGFQTCAPSGASYDACVCGVGDSAAGDMGTDGSTAATDSGEASPGDSSEAAPTDATSTTPTDAVGSDATSAADSTADTAPAPISPDKLTGLSLWLESDKGITLKSDGSLDTWADQSPNSNNAIGKGSAGYGPGILKSAVHGHDAVALGIMGASKSLLINDDVSLRFGTGGFAIAAVMRGQSPTVPGTPLWYQAGGTQIFQVAFDVNLTMSTPTATVTALFSTTGYHVVIARGPALSLRIDGVTTSGTTSTTDLSWPSGAQPGLAGQAEIDVAELVAVKGDLSDSDAKGLETYFKGKYGFTF